MLILLFHGIVLVSVSLKVLFASDTVQHRTHLPPAYRATMFKFEGLESQYTYEHLTLWNRSLCSAKSDRRGPHQKDISISVYGPPNNTDNPMYSWTRSIFPFLEPLAREVQLLEPSWVIRLYTDFIGSTHAQRELLSKFSNVDVCNMSALPLFDSALLTFLPGRMWRFVSVFDPFVDYLISHDLDSPMPRRQTETIDLWTSDQHRNKFSYVARDHDQHSVPILAGLWGAATVRARRRLFELFQWILIPSVARSYTGAGDQLFLSERVWNHVKRHALIFDSYFCREFGGQPFPSRRPKIGCYLGCIGRCCDNGTESDPATAEKPCLLACRPKDHPDWTYC